MTTRLADGRILARGEVAQPCDASLAWCYPSTQRPECYRCARRRIGTTPDVAERRCTVIDATVVAMPDKPCPMRESLQ